MPKIKFLHNGKVEEEEDVLSGAINLITLQCAKPQPNFSAFLREPTAERMALKQSPDAPRKTTPTRSPKEKENNLMSSVKVNFGGFYFKDK